MEQGRSHIVAVHETVCGRGKGPGSLVGTGAQLAFEKNGEGASRLLGKDAQHFRAPRIEEEGPGHVQSQARL